MAYKNGGSFILNTKRAFPMKPRLRSKSGKKNIRLIVRYLLVVIVYGQNGQYRRIQGCYFLFIYFLKTSVFFLVIQRMSSINNCNFISKHLYQRFMKNPWTKKNMCTFISFLYFLWNLKTEYIQVNILFDF